MQKNVGTIDAMIRITFGLFGLAWSVSHAARHPLRKMPKFVALLSAVKVAEGVTRFCPGLALLGLNTLNDEVKVHKATSSRTNTTGRKTEMAPHPSMPEHEERGTII